MGIAVGSRVADRFEILERAGVGGMAEVFRARDTHGGGEVALKLLRPADATIASRFAREASLLANLSHPRLVRYVDHGTSPSGRSWIAMEWLEGETLGKRLAREPLTLRESLAVARGIAEGLTIAHEAGVIHRDVKPANVILVGRSAHDVRLLDFGIARFADLHGDLTETGVRVGTYSFMSPEQAWGRRELGAQTDVFSLGCVLFACLTGRKPFAAKHSTAVLAKILLEPPPRVSWLRSDVAPELDELVARMMAKDPEARPSSAAEVLEELRAVDVGEGDRVSLPMEPVEETLTAAERRVVTLVLAANLAASEDPTVPASHIVEREGSTEEDRGPWVALRRAAHEHGARLDALADGTLVASFASTAGPIEHALKAAAYAQHLCDVAGAPPIAMATGLASLRGELPYGELIDRAVASLRRARPGEIRVDDVSAGLLGTRFALSGDARGLRLLGARGPAEGRQLLGRQSPFVGRRRELKTLEAVFEECVEDEVSRVALVTGAAGVGKSRLRDELLRRLRGAEEPPTVIVARADPVTNSPLGLIADAVRRTAQLVDGEPPAVRHQRLRGRLSRVLGQDPPSLERCATFLGELVGAPAPAEHVGVELEAARADARLMGDRMRGAFEEWLAAEATQGPVLIVIEDLHWGDAPSVSFLDSALAHLTELPWMVLAVARPEVHTRFPRLWVGRHVQELRLPGLTRKAARSLIAEVLGDRAEAGVVDVLVGRAQGNAFYLEELIRAVAEGQGDALPPTVLAMVQARLERLPEEARRVLRAASVFGQTFWSGGLLALLGGDDETTRLDDWIAQLVHAELVTVRAESRFEGERELVFRHALFREGSYGTLTAVDCERGHRLAARWLAEAGEADASVLAAHHERGGELDAAAPHYARAAQQALEANDLEGVIGLADKALRVATGELRGRALLAQAEAHRWRGESAHAFDRATEAAEQLDEGSGPWYRAVTEALVASANQQRVAEILQLVTRAVRSEPQAGASLHHAIFAARAGPVKMLRETGAAELFEKMHEEAAARGPLLAGWVRASQASMAAHGGRLGQSVRAWEESLRGFDQAGDKRNACTQRMNAGYVLGMLGAYEDAERRLREARSAAENLGLAQTSSWALHNLGLVVAKAGRVEEGLALEREALAEATAQGNSMLTAICNLYLAMIELDHEAEAALEPARCAAEGLSMIHNAIALAEATQALATLRARGAAAAMPIAERALATYREHGVDEMDALVFDAVTACLDAAGRTEEADTLAREGAEVVRRAAALIAEPDLRAQFLTRVPENAAVLERAARAQTSSA